MISIALPKGRLGRAALERMGGADGACTLEGQGRRLVLEDEARNVRYFLVKPSDTAIYVEHGVADIGIAGRIDHSMSFNRLPAVFIFDNNRIYNFAFFNNGGSKGSVQNGTAGF